ncbi:MAG: hypothetical protein EXX96DRAFT_290639 [Benjaminiella poitrasii]|nr:MAG: hypothetical protein EXX96DRAFT_290639 [Benjaminiella poitrasii]
MTEQRIEEITDVLKQVNLSSIDRELLNGKFIPKLHARESKAADLKKASANLIRIQKGDVTLNSMTPREQEKEDELVIKGLDHLFDNRFMAAKTIFEEKADRDPLNALALSSMAFLKGLYLYQLRS